MIVNAFSAVVVAFPFALFAWLIFDKTGAKSVGPAPQLRAGLDVNAFLATSLGGRRPAPPHVPADVDLAQCVATTRAIAYDVDDWLAYDRLPPFRAAPSDPPAVRAFLEGTP